MRDAYGGISMTRDIGALVSKESGSWWGSKEITWGVTAKGLTNGLMAEAYSQERNLAGKMPDGRDRDPRLIGGARPR